MSRPQDESERWIVHEERPVYENEWVTVGLADISQPSGDRFEHHTVTLPAAAMTVVLDDAGEHVLLSWRHRFVLIDSAAVTAGTTIVAAVSGPASRSPVF